MLEALQLISYVNLLAILPLYGARYVVEHGTLAGWPWSEAIFDIPGLLPLAVVIAVAGIGWRLAAVLGNRAIDRQAILANAAVMFVAWVLVEFLRASPDTRTRLQESWTAIACLLLLGSGLWVPLQALHRLLENRRGTSTGTSTGLRKDPDQE